MKICDIIIPIYNAYDALKTCIESVIKNTDLNQNNLILIDDCSPDKNIKQYLLELEKKFSNINLKILYNKKNMGFVGTVNRGMKFSQNDVLLLNSDTEVPKNWLENIKKCAYSMDNIATVTPLSNNATLVSVPKGLEKNEIPKNIGINDYNDMIYKCSYHDYPELPTGHGFCMFIKRDILDLVGYFDEKTFERGYGEENDFCFRCLDYGYRNIMCDDVVVYHKESQSFSDERQKVIKDHLKKLENRYPEYKLQLDDWCSRFPIKYICKNINYYINIVQKKNILILIHDWETSTGGTTLHVKDLISSLNDKYNFHVLYPKDCGYVLSSYFNGEENKIYLQSVEKMTKFDFYNEQYKKMLEDIIVGFSIDTIHIHHMISHYFDIIDLANKYKINSMITLHDYYCLCPTINLLYCGEKFCMNLKNKDCAKCLSLSKNVDHDIISEWRKNWFKFLKKFDRIIVPSEDTKKRILKSYKGLNINAIEHGIKFDNYNYNAQIKNTFNVAFIGVMCNHKGGNILKKLINKSDNSNIKFHVFGISEIEELKKNKKNYVYHGKYKRDNLIKLLKENNINLICFFQIWPETYSYTLNEAIAAGIPVLSFDIGAGAERVKKYNLGWTIDVNSDIKEIEIVINNIIKNPEKYYEKINSIKKYEIKTVDQMINEYIKFYDNDVKKRICNDGVLRKIIKDEQIRNGEGVNEKLNEILNSTKWKLINKIKFPTKFVYLVRKIKSRRRR